MILFFLGFSYHARRLMELPELGPDKWAGRKSRDKRERRRRREWIQRVHLGGNNLSAKELSFLAILFCSCESSLWDFTGNDVVLVVHSVVQLPDGRFSFLTWKKRQKGHKLCRIHWSFLIFSVALPSSSRIYFLSQWSRSNHRWSKLFQSKSIGQMSIINLAMNID